MEIFLDNKYFRSNRKNIYLKSFKMNSNSD